MDNRQTPNIGNIENVGLKGIPLKIAELLKGQTVLEAKLHLQTILNNMDRMSTIN